MALKTNMSRGEIARHTGCNIETVRYYERIGLLADPPRTDGGHRVYDTEHVKRLAFILRGRALGFSIEELREFLGLVDGGAVTCAEVKSRTLDHLANVRHKLSDLKRLEKVLKDISNQREGNESPDYPIIDALYDDSSSATSRQRQTMP